MKNNVANILPDVKAEAQEQILKQLAILSYKPGDKVSFRLLPPKGRETLPVLKQMGFTYKHKDGSDRKSVIKGYFKLTDSPNQRYPLYRQFGNNVSLKSPDAIEWLLQMNREGWSVYLVVNPGGQEGKDIECGRVLFYEDDNKTKQEQLRQLKYFEEKIGASASLVVETANSCHIYFRLNQALPVEDWTRYQQRLIQQMDSDKSIHDAPRMMRLAGFDHTSICPQTFCEWEAFKEGIEVPNYRADPTGDTPFATEKEILDQIIYRTPIWIIRESDTVFDIETFDRILPGWDETEWGEKETQKEALAAPVVNRSTTTVASLSDNLSDLLEREIYPRSHPLQLYNDPCHNWQEANGGNKYRGCCPWHDSQSGTSFHIEPKNGVWLWHCPSCNIGGNPIEYRYRLKGGNGVPTGKDFVEVVKELAEEAGVEIHELKKLTDRRNNPADSSNQTPREDGRFNKQKSPLCGYSDKGKPYLLAASDVAKILMEEYREKIAYNVEDQYWYRYESEIKGVWAREPEDLVHSVIQSELDSRSEVGYSAGYVKSIATLMRSYLAARSWDEASGLLPMRNGVLNLKTLEFSQHAPGYRFTWALPYDYNPAATCQPIINWLSESQDGDDQRVQLLRAYLNAIVKSRTDLQRFLECLGPAGTGKSTYTRLAVALIGRRNTFITSLKALEGSRFETAGIFGKRLVLISDSERYGGSVDVLKALTGQDPLRYEEKNKQPREGFAPSAMVLLVANEAIQTSDYTSGLARRRLTIPFLYQVPPDKRRDLITLTHTGVSGEFVEYLPGLLNWVLAMPDDEVTRLIRNTAIEVPSLNRWKNETLLGSNPLAEWLDACCVFVPEAKTYVGKAEKVRRTETTGEPGNSSSTSWEEYQNYWSWLYANYRKFNDTTGSKAISMRRFSDLLLDLCRSQLQCPFIRKDKDRDGSFFQGITIRTSEHENLPNPITGEMPDPPSSPVCVMDAVMDCDGCVMDETLTGEDCDGCDGSFSHQAISEKKVSSSNFTLEGQKDNQTPIHKELSQSITSITSLSQADSSHYTSITPPRSIHHTTPVVQQWLPKVGDRVKAKRLGGPWKTGVVDSVATVKLWVQFDNGGGQNYFPTNGVYSFNEIQPLNESDRN